MAADQSGPEQAIKDMHRIFLERVRHSDAAGLADRFYATDARLMTAYTEAITGRQAIRDFWQGLFNTGSVAIEYRSEHIDVEGDLAYATGAYELAIQPENAGIMRDTGNYLEVYRRRPNGTWQCIADMFASDRAPNQ